MAVLVRMTVAGVDEATYDQVSAHLGPAMKQQPGFMMHVAYPTPDGFYVGEIWESRAQFETWFNENVKPNVPAEIQPQVTELHVAGRPWEPLPRGIAAPGRAGCQSAPVPRRPGDAQNDPFGAARPRPRRTAATIQIESSLRLLSSGCQGFL